MQDASEKLKKLKRRRRMAEESNFEDNQNPK